MLLSCSTWSGSVPSWRRMGPLLLLGIFAMCASAGAESEGTVPSHLMARAEAEGSVRVVVELRAVAGGIPAAQEALLQALAGTRHLVTQRFTAIPFLALEASPEALRRLANLPVVQAVREDRLHAPQERTP